MFVDPAFKVVCHSCVKYLVVDVCHKVDKEPVFARQVGSPLSSVYVIGNGGQEGERYR